MLILYCVIFIRVYKCVYHRFWLSSIYNVFSFKILLRNSLVRHLLIDIRKHFLSSLTMVYLHFDISLWKSQQHSKSKRWIISHLTSGYHEGSFCIIWKAQVFEVCVFDPCLDTREIREKNITDIYNDTSYLDIFWYKIWRYIVIFKILSSWWLQIEF